jgi:glycerol-3-phosphate dehydrogenase (NAD(P)+)
MANVAVIGAGAWGTALSIALARKGKHRLRLWAYETEVCEGINSQRANLQFLPGQRIPADVRATTSLKEAVQGADIVVSVMPSHHCRRVFEQIASAKLLRDTGIVVSATKGIEDHTFLRMTQVITEVLERDGSAPPSLAALSGPSFAQEVARGDPTAVTLACKDMTLAETLQREFSDPAFRIYSNDDVIGVELGGALKNIIAIAAGVCDGLGLGHNTVAALITRGLAEISRLAVGCGARRETMAGLAGMGDLVLTCTGGLSRNRTVGVELGRGRKLSEIIAGMHGMVAEGVNTTNAALGLARRVSEKNQQPMEMPITEQMHAILHKDKSPREAIRELMTRPGRVEC